MLQSLIFWGSWLYFPAMVAGVVLLRASSGLRARIAITCMMLGLSVLAYARFVEPRILLVEERRLDLAPAATETTDIRIALIGDPHYGVFRNAMPMDRIVERVREEKAQALFIAGDLTYFPDPDMIYEHFEPLQDLDIPVFAVMGNHDVGIGGHDLSAPVLRALNRLNVQTVENRAVQAQIGESSVIVAGASDLWQRAYDFGFSTNLPEDKATLLLVHNPDTAAVVPESFDYDLMLAGHTHGGQIRLPLVYKFVIPTIHPFDKGLHTVGSGSNQRLVYVTPGTGMIGLPMRFLIPPQIDILTLSVPLDREAQDPESVRR
ncbi:MAG: metallophosphoesterase [Pseudomonadota bacterium]